MTDTDTTVARLEAVLDRLERLGLVAPGPGTQAATDPDGYPAAVVSGELIEAAWGNAVVDKLRVHENQLSDSWAQYGILISSPVSGSTYEIEFPEAFDGPPAVSIINADTAAVPLAIIGLTALDETHVQFSIHTPAGVAVTGPFRAIWIAHGPKVLA